MIIHKGMKSILALTLDNKLISEMNSTFAKKRVAEVRTFSESLELIDYFLKQYVPLIVLDIDVLKEKVLHLIRILRSIHRETQFILVLSSKNMQICSAALSQGVVSYQVKPISTENMLEVVASTLKIPIHNN
ncbi:hypothetical protein B1H10_00880 [candidate division KSB1 bacterium 4484_188]|nr:MAG: hypothetical protein B1H10_00880 [candidate division KSB1 bacterium 4484_188]HFE64433.1 response regulator [Caldithrix sp.]